MPYNSIDSLPPQIKDPLPVGAQKMWMRGFNSAYRDCKKRGRSDSDCEEQGRIVGWVYVKTKYQKDGEGKWQLKKKK
jgi:cation transport regulator